MSKKLIKTTSIFASMTLVTRILGFVRDTIAAQLFGASAAMDAFYIAFKIPNFLRGISEGPFSQVLIPVLAEYRKTRSHEEVKQLISCIVGIMTCLLLSITVLGILGAEQVLSFIVPGLDPYRHQLAKNFLYIIFPYLPLISLAALGVAVMNSYGMFWGASLMPIWLNLSLIVSALGLSRYFSVAVTSQAWGVLIAGFIQLLFVLPFLQHLKLLSWPRFSWNAGVSKVMKLMGPALLGASGSQIGVLINGMLASFLPVGSITWLYCADRLVYFPLSVFGISLSTAILATLSHQHASGDCSQFNRTLNWGTYSNLLVGFPIAIAFGFLAGPLVTTLFKYGRFTEFDVIQTQYAILGYAVGVPAFMLSKVLGAAYYAKQDIKTPVKITFGIIGFNMAIGAYLVSWLNHHGAITLASTLSGWVQVLLLGYGLIKQHNITFEGSWKKWGGLICANSALALFLYTVTPLLARWFQWDGFYRTFILGLIGITGIMIYSVMLRILGFKSSDIFGK